MTEQRSMGEPEEPAEVGSADIAIVGMAGRFPASADVDELWRNVLAGENCIRFFTEEELREAGVDEALFRDPNYVPAHGYVEGIDQFDAAFFDISHREAEVTDPQIRLFLETCWEALENAGLDPERYPGAVGVFAGASNNAYVLDNLITRPDVIEAVGYTQAALGNHTDFVATRVSYKLDLRGPSLTVQTACSTSLVATHLACQSLLSGESDAVLAGGACVTNLKKQGYLYTEGGTNTHDGKVRTFDAAADGMLGGNGVAVVVLKRLEDALADGDTIRAVIKGTAINNDGLDKVTFTAPSVNGQAGVIMDALDVADVDPATIGMVEAHGTGTPLGDPIEIAALTQAWRERTEDVGYCRIGSIKTNVGHLDIAAGVTGLIKTALALEHGVVPPSLNFERPNPEIDFASSPFVVNTEATPFEARGADRRRAAMSSFGMGGTNAHAILEQAPERSPGGPSRSKQLLLLSARTPEALDAATERLRAHLESDAGRGQDLADVAFTLQVGRKGFDERRAVVVADRAEAVEALGQLDRLRTVEATRERKHRPTAFLFTGQGAQYPGMLRGVYESEAVYAEQLDRCLELFERELGRDLRGLLLPEPGAESKAAEELALTQNTQPALFAVEYALARLWMEWGVEPDAMIGHSIGEYAAACLAGVFSLEDAVKLVAARGRLIGALPAGGGMLAVHLDEAEVLKLLPPDLSIAAINAPSLVVVSGPEASIVALETALEPKGVSTRRLHTSHAFHSALMDPCLDAFREVVRGVTLNPPERELISCATGTWLTDAQATDPEYWVSHVRNAVRFADGIRTLDDGSDRVLLEVGPGETLRSLAQLCMQASGREALPAVNSARHPKDAADDLAFLLRAAGELWCHGVELDWERGFAGRESRRRVALPTYPFERESYWVEPGDELLGVSGGRAAGGLPDHKSPDLADWFFTPSWQRTAPAVASREPGKRWLLFCDEGGLAEALAKRLHAAGADVITAVPARAFKKVAPRAFELAPGDPASYQQLIDELAATGGVPTELVHLYGADTPETIGTPDELQDRCFFSPMFLGRALSSAPLGQGTHVATVTVGMQGVLERPAFPEKATVLGPAKSLRGELESVTSVAIDLAADATLTTDDWAERLMAELLNVAADPVVALTSHGRWALGYAPVPIPASDAAPELLRQGGTYLITGGLGGIGLTLAEVLVKRCGAKLVLTGRAGLPPRDEWDAWLEAKGADEATSAKIASVRGLEQLGGQVLVVAADVADLGSMRQARAEAEAAFGPVHGVIHAAGLTGAGLMAMKSREDAQAVLSAKVTGTRVLAEVFGGLDFLFLCSSISTATGIFAGVDYAAANAFLDAFANARDGLDGRVLAGCWDTWRDVGIATHAEVPEAMRAAFDESMRLGIAPAEGAEAFERLLRAGLPQVYVSTRDLRLRDEFARPDDAAATGGAADGAPDGARAGSKKARRKTHSRPKLSTEYAEPSTEIEGQIAAMWADLLGLDQVGTADNFFELGGNSLVMMQVNVRLRAMFGIQLPVRELFEMPEVSSLAERIEVIRAVSDSAGGDESSEEVEEFTL